MRTPTQKPPEMGDTGALADLIRVFAGAALREFEKQMDEESVKTQKNANSEGARPT